MNFVHFFNQTLGPMGFDIVNTIGAVQRPYGNEDGWPLVLPECEFTEKTLVIVHDLYPSKEAVDSGSAGAMTETLDQLDELLASL